ncbi:SRPBCC family protein [Aeromicrobium marinum]|uniref:SRPBCC family protein n=1 Tax=Aeromicrobium marinum TaxID=219314 RepID=UPI0001BCE404|nr:SRPBCC family protein [Aeromicrobium marinum]
MVATPTATLEHRDGTPVLVFTRTFSAPAQDVWDALTVSDRVGRWFGTWTGDPADGFVTVRMTAEGDDVPESRFDLTACDAPRRLDISCVDDFGSWNLELTLVEESGSTTLTMRQVIDDPGSIENVGPGWEYYLDRMVAAETGGDPAAVDFEADYYPAQQQYFLDLQG